VFWPTACRMGWDKHSASSSPPLTVYGIHAVAAIDVVQHQVDRRRQGQPGEFLKSVRCDQLN
jgi:hypothetical protein